MHESSGGTLHKGQLIPRSIDEVQSCIPKFNLELQIQLSQQIP